MMYCKTISESGGRHIYGIDLISFVSGEFNILLSAQNVTDNWISICRFVRWVNIIDVPPMQFYEVLDAFNEKIAEGDPEHDGSETGLSNKSESGHITYRIREKGLWRSPFELDKNVIDRICRILECKPDELYLAEE